MPLYEFKCECGGGESKILPISRFDQPQACECGKVMQLQVSLSSFVMKQTGRGMALNTLNGNQMPNKHWKAHAEQSAAAGL